MSRNSILTGGIAAVWLSVLALALAINAHLDRAAGSRRVPFAQHFRETRT